MQSALEQHRAKLEDIVGTAHKQAQAQTRKEQGRTGNDPENTIKPGK